MSSKRRTSLLALQYVTTPTILGCRFLLCGNKSNHVIIIIIVNALFLADSKPCSFLSEAHRLTLISRRPCVIEKVNCNDHNACAAGPSTKNSALLTWSKHYKRLGTTGKASRRKEAAERRPQKKLMFKAAQKNYFLTFEE